MACITYGALVTEITGSIAGTTFHRNPSGAIGRQRPFTPVNPSELQSGNQVQLADLVSLWSSFDASSKNSWNAIAASYQHTTPWGNLKTLSGFQWFMCCNRQLLSVGQPVITDAGAYAVPAAPNTFLLVSDAGSLVIDFGATYTSNPHYVVMYATPPLRANQVTLKKSSFIIDVRIYNAVDALNITSIYEAYFNLNWATFYAAAHCSIIIKLKAIYNLRGYNSVFSSAIGEITTL